MLFFENHDVTQGDRQGEDVGIQYRSVIFPKDDEQLRIANQIKDLFQGKKFSLVI
jgi:peptide methionine sulfoxide reductase MsrA